MELFLRSTAGALSRTFTVRNTTTEAVTVQIQLSDWKRVEDGTNLFAPAGTLPGSCSPGIRVFPATLRLAANQMQTIQVTYEGGPRTTSCWSSVSVEVAAQPVAAARGAQLVIHVIQQVKIYVEPPEGRPALELLDADITRHAPTVRESPADTLRHDVIVRVTNPGRIQSRVKTRVEYRTLTDSVIARAVIDEFPILPGATRTLRSAMPALPAGRYVVLVLLDYGGADILAGQIDLDLSR